MSVALTLALGVLLLAVPAAAQDVASAPAAQDADLDGVADVVDRCPASEALELVDATGCSVCPCSARWESHAAYVSCVSAEAARRALPTKVKTAVMKHANASTCGSTNTVRCCSWSVKAKYGSMGTCTVMAPEQCSFGVLKKFAERRGLGSCYYNPCTW